MTKCPEIYYAHGDSIEGVYRDLRVASKALTRATRDVLRTLTIHYAVKLSDALTAHNEALARYKAVAPAHYRAFWATRNLQAGG